MRDPVLLDLPTTLDTARLRMRPPRAGDGPALFAAVTEALPELRRFLASLPWVASEPSVASSERFCRNGEANFLARKDLPFLMFERATDELIGAVGLHRIVWETPKAEVGYWIRSSRRGHGLVGEAVRALCDYAFEHLHAVRVELVTDVENDRSRRVADRCGFQLEGLHRHDRRSPEGDLRSTCVYARLAPTGVQDAASSFSEARSST